MTLQTLTIERVEREVILATMLFLARELCLENRFRRYSHYLHRFQAVMQCSVSPNTNPALDYSC